MHMRATRLSSVLAICVFVLCLSSLASAQATCTLSTTNRTVTICTPASNATVGTTFHVNAGTTSSLPVAYMQVYVNYVLYATQKRNFLDATITVPAGTHQHFTVQAKDSSGVFFKTSYYVNVVASTYSIAPLNPTLAQGATQQFTASAASTWSASCGSISSSGLYTAPNTQTSCTVTGTATDGSGHTASTTVTVSSGFTVSPTTASVSEGATQQFSASLGATWAASCGSVDGTGLFTAPLTAGILHRHRDGNRWQQLAPRAAPPPSPRQSRSRLLPRPPPSTSRSSSSPISRSPGRLPAVRSMERAFHRPSERR